MIGRRHRVCIHANEGRGRNACKQNRLNKNEVQHVTLYSKHYVCDGHATVIQDFGTSNAKDAPSPSRLAEQLGQISAQFDQILKWQQTLAESLLSVRSNIETAIRIHEEPKDASETITRECIDIMSATELSTSELDIRALQQELTELRSYVLLLPTILSRENNINAFNN